MLWLTNKSRRFVAYFIPSRSIIPLTAGAKFFNSNMSTSVMGVGSAISSSSRIAFSRLKSGIVTISSEARVGEIKTRRSVADEYYLDVIA